MDVWEPFQLYLMIVLVWLLVSTRSDIVGKLGEEIPKENTTILSDLFGVRWQGAKGAKRWKGANVQTAVSWVSQPVALSGLTSICSNPWKDEEPLITWTGLTVRASCSGSSSGEQKSGAELVIQQKRLMIMDGVCSLYWTHLLLVVSCPPTTAHQYIFSLPPSSVILCTPL